MRLQDRKEIFSIVALYALFGLAWIYGSDIVLGWLVTSQTLITEIAVINGSIFILLTATLLFYIIDRFFLQLTLSRNKNAEILENYLSIFNATNDAILVHETQNGQIVDMNERALEMFDYARDEMLQIDISHLSAGTPPYSQQEASAHIARAMVKGPQVFEWHARKKNGELFWTEISLRSATHFENVRIIAVIRDIGERKQAVAEANRKERRYALAITATADAIWEWHCATGETYFSPHWYEMLGYSDGQLPMTFETWTSLCHPDDTKLVAQAILATHKNNGFRAEYRMRHSNGSWVWILGRGSVVEHNVTGEPTLLVGANTDITQLKYSEKYVQEAEAKYQRLHKSMTDAFALVDMNGAVVECNAAFQAMTGYSEAELHQMSYENLTPPHWHAMEEAILREQVLVNGASDVYEKEYLRKDGVIIPVELRTFLLRDDFGQPTGMWAIIRDISERKRHQKKMTLLNFALNSIKESVGLLNEQGAFHYVNDELCRSLGYDRNELLAMNVSDIDPDFSSENWPQYLSLLKNKGALAIESQHRTKDGTLFPVNVQAYYVECEGVGYNLTLARDITEVIRTREECEKFERKLLHTQKLESLGVLAGGVAHDFNNILTGIIGNANLALMRLNPESPVTVNLRGIIQSADRAAELAKQMLAYSGKGKFVVEPINLNRLIQEMLSMLQASISKKVVLRINADPDLASIEADATQIRQIVMNLVINASEAIGEKSGIVTITTNGMDCCRRYLSEFYLNEELPEGKYVCLEVADSGCGMDRETIAKIFDPFFTTKFMGRGLGLAAVLGIVRGHKGTIKIYSELGKGSTFKILLPASGIPVQIPQDIEFSDDWKGEGKALLVDDEKLVLEVGAAMLRELGFTPVLAKDGREAILMYREHPDIAFVVLDLTMPHMDGEQCFRELRSMNPDIKVIMSSGYSEHEVAQRFVGKELAGFIQKPYTIAALKGVIKAAT